MQAAVPASQGLLLKGANKQMPRYRSRKIPAHYMHAVTEALSHMTLHVPPFTCITLVFCLHGGTQSMAICLSLLVHYPLYV